MSRPPATKELAPPSSNGADAAPSSSRRGIRGLLREASRFGEVRRTPYGLAPAVILALLTMFQAFDSFTFRFATPEIAADLGISASQIIGLLVTVGTILIAANLFLGWYCDRHKRVPVVGIGAIISGIAAMGTNFVRSGSFTLGLSRVTDEVSDLASGVPRYALLADYYPPDVRGKAFAILSGAFRFAQVLAPLAAGGLIVWIGWRPTFLIFGAGIVLMGIIVLVRLREPVRGYMERHAVGFTDDVARIEDEPQSFGEAWRTTWAVRTLRRLFIADCFSRIDEVFGLFLIFFLSERYGLDPLERGLVFVPTAVVGVIGYYIGGGLIDVFTRRNPGRVLTLRGGLEAMAALTVILVAVEPPLWLLIGVQCIYTFGFALSGPATNVIYSQVIPPSIRTQGLQVFALAAIPTTVLFLPLSGAIRFRWGYTEAFLAMVPVLLLGALIAATAGAFFEMDMRANLAGVAAREEWLAAKRRGRGKLLVCRDVDVHYDGVQVLFGVDFDVEEGEIVALLGTNGAGKSTLLRAISGIQEATSGAIVFDGRDITHMPPHEIAGRHVIAMPGGRGVFPGLSVRENLVLGNWMTDDEDEVRARLGEVFEIFPMLAARADALAGTLSGGEQQQLSLAQAFLASPKLLMIDELSLGLSPAVVGELLEVIRRIHARGVTIIVVEQSVNVALNLAERAIFMEKGEVRFDGSTADLLRRPDILRAVYVKGTGALTDGAPAGARRSERDQRFLDLREARPVLEVSAVSKQFGGVLALDGVDLELREGEVLGLIGPNGSGKTTLFDIISGFQRPDHGSVVYEGVDVTALGPEERARRRLVRRFQDARLFPSLTVFETLLVSLEQRLEVRSTALAAVQLPAARRAERRLRVRAERLIELFELQSYRDKFVKELSTGLRRIVDLACVLAAEPRVLLLDEPSSGIAQAEAEGLAPLLRRVRFETGCSILIIEHDMPLISAVADELVALERGQVLLRGRPEEVLNDDRVIESYLGGSEQAVRRSGSLV
jgi:branched-chain amino acid transport system ATP-binding protein